MIAQSRSRCRSSDYKAQHVRLDGRRQGRDADARTGRRRRTRSPSRATPRSRTSSAPPPRTSDVKAFVITGEGGNFCSGGDVFEIIGPLVEMDTVEPARLHPHDRRGREGDARSARSRSSRRSTASAPAPARSSRWRPTCGSAPRRPRSRSCSTASALPAATWAPARSCRASSARAAPSELLYTGRAMGGEEAERWGFFNRLVRARSRARRGDQARERARRRADLRQRA